jgi:hypothetical protein
MMRPPLRAMSMRSAMRKRRKIARRMLMETMVTVPLPEGTPKKTRSRRKK